MWGGRSLSYKASESVVGAQLVARFAMGHAVRTAVSAIEDELPRRAAVHELCNVAYGEKRVADIVGWFSRGCRAGRRDVPRSHNQKE